MRSIQTLHAALNESGIAMITVLLVLMLMSALLVGFTTVVMSDQRYRFIDRDRGQAFYAASAGDREAHRRSRQPVSRERRADRRADQALTDTGQDASDLRHHVRRRRRRRRRCRRAS